MQSAPNDAKTRGIPKCNGCCYCWKRGKGGDVGISNGELGGGSEERVGFT